LSEVVIKRGWGHVVVVAVVVVAAAAAGYLYGAIKTKRTNEIHYVPRVRGRLSGALVRSGGESPGANVLPSR